MDRREFIKGIAAGVTGIVLAKYAGSHEASAEGRGTTSEVFVAKGGKPVDLTRRAVGKAGGMGRFVPRGKRVVIKPNIGWDRTPEQGANTHPDVVGALVAMCREAGAREVIVLDNPCNPWVMTYKKSGIEEAVKAAGGAMRPPVKFRGVQIPNGKVLKEADILEEILDADVVINVPVVKVHGSQAKVTLSMKNWMGIVKNRGFFHSSDLNQCIADVAGFMKPSLTVLDATRVLLTNGPQGPGAVRETNTVVAGIDFVALDAFGTTLLGLNPAEVRHIQIAAAAGLGQADLTRVRVVNA